MNVGVAVVVELGEPTWRIVFGISTRQHEKRSSERERSTHPSSVAEYDRGVRGTCGWVMLSSIAVLACNPCKNLEDKMCADLGAEDCAIWRAPPLDRLGVGRGHMNAQMCSNAMDEPTYGQLLDAARKAVAAQKKVKAP